MPCWRSRAAFRSVSHLTAGGDHAGPPLEAPDSCAREREWTRWTHRGGGKARSTACLPFTLVPNGWVSQTMMTALWKPREDGRRVRNPTLVLNLQFNGTSDDAALAISQAATLNPTLQVPTRIRCPRDVRAVVIGLCRAHGMSPARSPSAELGHTVGLQHARTVWLVIPSVHIVASKPYHTFDPNANPRLTHRCLRTCRWSITMRTAVVAIWTADEVLGPIDVRIHSRACSARLADAPQTRPRRARRRRFLTGVTVI
jgi:hypothetical protein